MKNQNSTGISLVTPEVSSMWMPALEQHFSAAFMAHLPKSKINLLIGMANAKAESLMVAAGVESVNPESMANFFAMENFVLTSAANAGVAPNVANPVNGGHNGLVAQNAQKGSGDKQYMVGLCIAIAAKTVGLELVQSIPATSQNVVIDILDVKYGGGAIDGAANTNDYVFTVTFDHKPVLEIGKTYSFKVGSTFVQGRFVKLAREVKDGFIFELVAKFTATVSTNALSNVAFVTNTNLGANLSGAQLVVVADALDSFAAVQVSSTNVLIATIAGTNAVENYVPYQTTMGLKRTLTRSEADAGSDRTMELDLQNESFTIGNRTFNGHIARLQFKRLEERGLDPIAFITTAMKNEVSQEINWQIISTARALGLQNHLEFEARGISFNTMFAPTTVTSKAFSALLEAGSLTDVDGNKVATSFKAVQNVLNSMAFENIQSLGTAVCMFIKQAAYVIGTNSRYGDADAVVLPTGLAAYVSSSSEFTALTDKNVIIDSKSGAKQIGNIGSIKVYVDVQQNEASPFVTVLRTNQDIVMDVPGVSDEQPILMPGIAYLVKDLISTVDLVPEQTGGRKVIMDSETDLVLVGRRPAAGYLTFAIDIALPGLGIAQYAV